MDTWIGGHVDGWMDDGQMDEQAERQTDNLSLGSLDVGSNVQVWIWALLLTDSYWPCDHESFVLKTGIISPTCHLPQEIIRIAQIIDERENCIKLHVSVRGLWL